MTWPDSSTLALAVGAGLVAAVNPCGFALLPAYLSVFVLDDSAPGRRAALGRAARATTALTLGFGGVFLLFGLAIAPVASSVQAYLPIFTVVLGVVLALAGGWVLAGRSLPSFTRRGSTARRGRALSTSWPAMAGFGASYAVASLGCTIAPFLAVVVSSFRSGSTTAGIVLFGAYALAMGAVVGAAAVAVALARGDLITRLRRSGGVMTRVGGGILLLAGAYVAWYGAWELRVLHGDAGADPVVGAAEGIQQWLAGRAAEVGLVGFAIVLAALAAVALLPRRRRDADEPDHVEAS
ncbi:hypothetical protein KUV85_08450 [Nocardioides panacisoli]|uniref:cytochrome c biogenesis CcdA family protein n=1 Tax=Nocardioides panacisoli TaxID=627624 RepID=UPI001C63B3C5|nr:cytochrome c biogenesis protein CcdA [Nocardioides panacisoli]QYJ05695.1 hypothetical protein KUV85_08450 [Nocardioides panacisoli]